MLRVGKYVFKRAETAEEFEEVHRLNYRTFVHEIPQHADPGDGRLVDKFHHKNTYFIVLANDRLIGMISGHGEPPYSVADRMPDSSVLHAPGTRPMEVRLLAIEPGKRKTTLCFGLLFVLYQHAQKLGYTHLFISAVKERIPLYRRLGFEQLGPPVAQGRAAFAPMVLTVGRLPKKVEQMRLQWASHIDRLARLGKETICLLPGPVTTAPAVRAAFHLPPIYHRGPEFIELYQKVRRTLGDLVGGRDVALLNGSGTLANEAVAATMAADDSVGRGLLLVNGEFGERLACQAKRFGLAPRQLSWTWGQPWDLDEVDAALAEEVRTSDARPWVWGVHQESSTGVLNDLAGLVRVAQRYGALVCVDCISSLGAVPIDLRGVYLATAATGKSLGAYAGVAIIFANREEISRLDLSRVPSYFDIGAALASRGPRYTFPSPVLQALDAALDGYSTAARASASYERYAHLGSFIRRQLRKNGVEPLAHETWACPVVTTFTPPADDSSAVFVDRCRQWGFSIGGQSSYLAERRLVQIASMGAVDRHDLELLFAQMSHWLSRQTTLVAH